MRRARSRPPVGLRRVQVQDPVVVAAVGDHRARSHHQAELHLDVGDERLDVVRAALGHDARRVAVVGLLDHQPRQRAPLGVVGLEQLRRGIAVDHRGELPRQVAGIQDARVAAEPAVGGDDVRRVAGEEDAPLAQAGGVVRLRPPVRDVDDLGRDVRRADGRLQQCLHALVGEAFADADGLVGGDVLAHVLITRNPVPPAAVQPEEAAKLRVVHVDDALVAVAQQRRAVGAEVDRDAPRELPVALHRDPETRARRAAVAVGGDDVAGAHRSFVAVVEVAQRGGHAVVVLLEPGDLGAVDDRRAELDRPLRRIGSSTSWLMKTRTVGLQPSTPSLSSLT